MTLDASQLRAHVRESLLPAWARHGWDASHGGFHSRLDHDWIPVPDGFKRLVVQMRQLYCYAIAGRDGSSYGAAARATADATFEHVRARFWDSRSGGWFLTTRVDGEPLDRSKDAYAHAFAILGLAHYARLRPEAAALEVAFETLDLLESRLADPRHGGFFEAADADWAPRAATRRHNPHMHLLEAVLALWEVSRQRRCLESAQRLVELFVARLYPAPYAGLPETFADDWSEPQDAPPEVEPGHHFEWFWLLDRAARMGLPPAPPDLLEALFDFAARHGVDPRDGAVFDRLHRDGRLLDARKRVWPQTEYLKALAIRCEREPTPARRHELELALDCCLSRYVDPAGGWREHAGPDGTIVSDAMNATTLYHVLTALDEVARVHEAQR